MRCWALAWGAGMKGTPAKPDRWLNVSTAAQKRRCARVGMMALRQKRRQTAARRSGGQRRSAAARDSRSKRRTKLQPCCGRERRYCECGKLVVKTPFRKRGLGSCLVARSFSKLLSSSRKRTIKTVADTVDVIVFHEEYAGNSSASFRWSWFAAVAFRVYSKESTWIAMKPALPENQTPLWRRLQATLARLRDLGTIHGGLFYAPKLTEWRGSARREWEPAPTDPAARDVRALRCVWEALARRSISEALAAYERAFAASNVAVARASFARAYDGFMAAMEETTHGFWGDYQMKIALDALCAVGWLPDWALARWPVACPSYKAMYRVLFPSVVAWTQEQRYHALMLVHSRLSAGLGANWCNVPCSLAQTCWFKRGVS